MKLEHLRGELLRNGVREGLDNNQVMLLWHLLDFDFDSKGVSWPGRKTLAQRMGFKNYRSISRMITGLVEMGFITRIVSDNGGANRYDWSPMIEKFSKYTCPIQGGGHSRDKGGVTHGTRGGSLTGQGGGHSRVTRISSIESLQEEKEKEKRGGLELEAIAIVEDTNKGEKNKNDFSDADSEPNPFSFLKKNEKEESREEIREQARKSLQATSTGSAQVSQRITNSSYTPPISAAPPPRSGEKQNIQTNTAGRMLETRKNPNTVDRDGDVGCDTIRESDKVSQMPDLERLEFPLVSGVSSDRKFGVVAKAMSELFMAAGVICPDVFVTGCPRVGLGEQYTALIQNRQWGDMLLPMTAWLLKCNPGRQFSALDVMKAWSNGLPGAWQSESAYDFDLAMMIKGRNIVLPEFLSGDGDMGVQDFSSKWNLCNRQGEILCKFAGMCSMNIVNIAGWRQYWLDNYDTATRLAPFSDSQLRKAGKMMMDAEYLDSMSLRTLLTFVLKKDRAEAVRENNRKQKAREMRQYE